MLLFTVLTALPSPGAAAPDPIQLADTYIPQLETLLKENIGSFWLTKALDHQYGGYTINFDATGQQRPNGTKMIVTQARTVWLFSRLARAGYGEAYLAAAEHGVAFLRDVMWDSENGGFFWEVDVTGNQRLNPRKHMYGQAFALYGISEYALASQNQEALEFATECFNLLEDKAHDNEYSGYLEFFDTDCSPRPAGTPSYLSVPAEYKLMNTHLHLLEAFTTFYRASQLALAQTRLQELILIQSNTMVRFPPGACTDKYNRDWSRRLDSDYARVSYGHDIENVWLLMDACTAIGLSNTTLLEQYKILYTYSMDYGYDTVNGGFFDSGAFSQPADKQTKVWWVQAEALVSALYLYRMTQNPIHLSVFETTFDFVNKYMVDHQHGEWHESVSPEGTVLDSDKGHKWKCGYHNGRAMIECMGVLESLRAEKLKQNQGGGRRR